MRQNPLSDDRMFFDLGKVFPYAEGIASVDGR